MTIEVVLQSASTRQDLPDETQISQWVEAALDGLRGEAELTVRIVDEEEGAQLNEQWRNGTGATNVLSFPAGNDLPMMPGLLGDIVICAPVVEKEAKEQGKTLTAHWAHLVIHGVLHLLGYDHQNDREAAVMEALEIEKLRKLGYGNPYT